MISLVSLSHIHLSIDVHKSAHICRLLGVFSLVTVLQIHYDRCVHIRLFLYSYQCIQSVYNFTIIF